MKDFIEKIHRKYLEKAFTAKKEDGTELTALPYGFVSKIAQECVEETKKEMIKEIVDYNNGYVKYDPGAEEFDVAPEYGVIEKMIQEVFDNKQH